MDIVLSFVVTGLCIVAVIGYIAAAFETAKTAHEKGHESISAAVCLFLGIPYMITVMSLPNLKARQGDNFNSEYTQSSVQTQSKGKGFGLVAVILVLVCAVGGFIYTDMEKKKVEHIQYILKYNDWKRHEIDDGSIYTLGLDFYNNYVNYTIDTYSIYFPKQTIARFDYEVIDSKTIAFTYSNGLEVEVNVVFNEEENRMTFEPALTNSDASEEWVVYDKL